MTAAESAALERLIAAFESNTVALLTLSSSKREEMVAEAQRIGREGLSRREAVQVVESVDTPSEQAEVRAYLNAYVSKADAVTLLNWLLNDAKRALAAPAVVTPATPESPAAGIVPHSGAVLYLPATCGWFNGGEDMGEILRWLATYRGKVGLNFEATGSTGNQGVRTMDCLSVYMDHCIKLDSIAAACARAGVPVKIDGVNSNDFGKGWAASWQDTAANRRRVADTAEWLAAGLLDLRDWCIVQPVSESKDWMRADFRRDVFDVWVKIGWPMSRLCGGGISETHTGELKSLNPPALASTDNGPAIERHFGKGVWTAHTPNVERCTAYAKHYLARGVHCSLYHRADRLHLLEHRAAYDQIIKAATGWRDSSPVAPPSHPTWTPGAALTFRYVGGGQRDVSWTPAVDRSGWPTKSVAGATCDGLLYGCEVGGEPRKIEWIKRGQQSAHTKNAWAFAKDRKYNQGWAGGERVRLEIRDVAGSAKGHGGEVVLT